MPRQNFISRFHRVSKESGLGIFKDALDEIMLQRGNPRRIPFHYPNSKRQYLVAYHRTWKLLQKGAADYLVMNYVRKLISASDTIFDIGADIGTYSLFFSELCKSVVTFEPDPVALSILRSNLQFNHVDNVLTEPLCVSNYDGQIEFVSERWAGSASKIKDSETSAPGIIVTSTRLDSYCKRKGIKPQGMKIDVEGAEALVVDGLEKENGLWLVVDFHGHLMKENSRNHAFQKITSGARDVRFVCSYDGTIALPSCEEYHTGDRITSIPHNSYFAMFVRY